MFDHVTIRVPDRDASERFFDTVLAALGVDTTYRTSSFTEWQDFMLAQATDDHHPTRRLHIAVAAPTREQVDGFWQAGVDAGYLDQGPPGPRPQYGEHYYGAFLREPGGNSIEAVHAGARRRAYGIIDHLWIRVVDLGAARAFYRIAAAAATFEVTHDSSERTTF
jgi:catechol 2,3-dioxygenase-like lactoylglutathione lyase family enzyme